MNNKVTELILKNQRMIEKATNVSPMAEVANKVAQIADQLESVSRFMNNTFATIEEFEQLLSELNYPPIPNMFGSHMKLLIKEINNLTDDKEAISLLDKFIVIRFNEAKLDQKVRIWRTFSWIGKRISILEQIVEAHKQGLYYLSVLAVFPQIEGMLAESFPEKRLIKNGKKEFTTKYLIEAFQEVLEVENDSYDKQWDKFYRENLLKGFQHLEPIEYLSRHALAHGADFEYGTQVNSVKSFIILDYIITKINNYIIHSSK